ncbi:MAG: cytochrome c biogenesis protein CcdA, partial [Dehalococcoidia bacterium]|nr:cytochrome c biogenesis protein CcdA [Dehalococcoidia bacterium]
ILAFLSPCVLPLVPVYLTEISGFSPGTSSRGYHRQITLRTLIFIIGFTSVFVLLGATAGAVGSFFSRYLWLFQKLAGTILVVFGLHVAGFLNIPILNYEKRFSFKTNKIPALLRPFILGTTLSLGWTPCIGPVLSGILALAVTSKTAAYGVSLMSVFSLGMALPFLAIGLFTNRIRNIVTGLNKHLRRVSLVSGIIVIIIGLIVFFDLSFRVNSILSRYLPIF